MGKKYIIGLDQSLTAFGYSIFTSKGKHVETGEYNCKYKGERRLLTIENWLSSILKNYPPAFVCKESYAYARAQQAHQLGELGWAVKRILYTDNIPFCEIAPITLKKFITGSGKGKAKNIIVRDVFRKWGFVAETDNEADAYALGFLGYCIYKQDFADENVCQHKYEEDCVKSVLTSKKKGICYGQAQEEIKRTAVKPKKSSRKKSKK